MSNVQTQIDRINGEVSAQKALISQIATALEGKAGGALKSASGEAKGRNSESFSISGLTFTPSCVLIYTTASTSGIRLVCYTPNVNARVSSTSVITTNSMAATMTDGVFTLTSDASYFDAGVTYTWYAYGI